MIERIRVLHVVEAALGGVRRYLENVVEATPSDLVEPGIAFSAGRADDGFAALLEACQTADWVAHEIPMVRSVDPWRDGRAILELRRLIRSWEPDVLHLHSSKAGAVGRLAARSMGRSRPATVFSPHASAVHLGGVYAGIERRLAPLSDLVAVISPSEGREVVGDGLADAHQVHVVPPIIDTNRYSPGRPDRVVVRAEPGERIVLGMGRLCPQKDPSLFLAVIGELRDMGHPVHAVWVGDGELAGEVAAKGVHVTGWVDDVVPYLRSADVLLMTSRYESFGYATAEAMAAGLPVVATAVAGSVDLVDHQVGRLAPAGDPSAVAAAAAELLASPDLRERLGARARGHVLRSFTQEGMTNALSTLYRRAHVRRAQRPPASRPAEVVS